MIFSYVHYSALEKQTSEFIAGMLNSKGPGPTIANNAERK
jgi:hypothetical protein